LMFLTYLGPLLEPVINGFWAILGIFFSFIYFILFFKKMFCVLYEKNSFRTVHIL